jgi:putative salt-induced outer membrane protein YdiY
MKMHVLGAGFGFFFLVLAAMSPAQTPPPKTYAGNIGAGFSLTRGNTDTTNFNLSGELTRDPKNKNVMKFNGLYLRAKANNVNTSDQLALGFRDEYSFSKKTFAYGALSYLRDPFKEINYLLNPQGGIGYKPILTDRVELSLSGGAGGVWEKNPGVEVRSSGTVNAGQSFSLKLSNTARITQRFAALWKTSDFNDALYHFNIAMVTSITKRSELKIEFIDDFKNVTPAPTIKKNDTAFIVSFLYKI